MKNVKLSLSPEQEIDNDRLREILRAEAEGRLIVLPVKLGTTVFGIRPESCTAEEEQKCEFRYDWRECEACHKRRGLAVFEKPFTRWDIGYEGRDMWLTREAAEAEVRRRRGDGNG